MATGTQNGSRPVKSVAKDMLPVVDAMKELGAPGLKVSGGMIDEEFLPDLRGRKAVRTFEEMRQNDSTVGAILFAIEHLMKQVTWTVTPADESAQSKDAAEFVDGALFKDMSTGWNDTLSEILTMLPFGWAYMEVVYKLRKGPGNDPKTRSKFTDGRVGWRKWSLRGQNTLMRWEFDDEGGIKAMVQNPPPKYQICTVPIEKALLFRTVSHRNNPEGRSILRNAYRPWFFKKHIEEIEGIGVERDLAGYPTFKVDKEGPDIWNKNDSDAVAIKDTLISMIQQVKRDEQEGMLLPWWVDFQLVSTGSRRAFDTSAIIDRYDKRIAMSMMADFVLLGSSDVGSYALSTDKSRIFASIMDGIMDTIADTINRHATPKLMEFNNIKPEYSPILSHSHAEPENVRVLSDFLSKLIPIGAITPTPEIEGALLDAAGLPLPADSMSLTTKRYAGRLAFQKALAKFKASIKT